MKRKRERNREHADPISFSVEFVYSIDRHYDNEQPTSNRLIAMQPYFAVFIIQCLLFLVICVYPANAGTKGATFGVFLPILFLPLWITYELLMPAGMNIRVDLFILLPMMLASAIIMFYRSVLFRSK